MSQGVAPMAGPPAPGASPYGQQVSLPAGFSRARQSASQSLSKRVLSVFFPHCGLRASSGRSSGASRAAGPTSVSWPAPGCPCHTAAFNTHVRGSPTEDPAAPPLRGVPQIHRGAQRRVQQHQQVGPDPGR